MSTTTTINAIINDKNKGPFNDYKTQILVSRNIWTAPEYQRQPELLDVLVSESVERRVKLEVVERNTVVPPFQDDL